MESPNTPETSTIKSNEPNLNSVIGDVVLGINNHNELVKNNFHKLENPLYHGAAKEFSYSPEGKYDVLDTGGDGTTDYGYGFYTTDNLEQAKNYSKVRGNIDTPVVYTFFPINAKMLDVRDINNPKNNGVLPNDFVQDWVSFLEICINDDEFKKNDTWDFKSMIEENFLDPIKKAFKNKGGVSIQGGRRKPTIFNPDMNGLIDTYFREFMISKNYDGMIYREGGEGKNAENLTGYIFYNPKAIDTQEGWEKRKE